MLRVADLLSLPLFETFRLISGPAGLHNAVTGSSILEWETPKEIAVDFAPNDFVMTTLYMYRNELEKADEALKALIKRRVAAIAIKTTFTDTCSQEVLELADLYKIPIFTYRDVYMEDLIFAIENAVFTDNSNEIALDYLKYLMEAGGDKLESAAGRLNPLFCEHMICCCLMPYSGNHSQILDDALASYRKTAAAGFHLTKSSDSFIRCSRCIIIIRTAKTPPNPDEAFLREMERDFGIDLSLFRIGFSETKTGLSRLRDAVSESINAALSALSMNESLRHFGEIGADALILPNLNNAHFKAFYGNISSRLSEYDKTHASHLTETLLCYIESDGDVTLTAKKMFQHGNTIRYRLDKIKNLLGIAASPDAYVQLYIFAKMHRLYQLTGSEPII